ncbi:unannotated protein [freshwater metagenome]|uniref:Unannotated protein n=1 Tax=freshwater metagenome TaxID=449393 RepID=A0A6J7UF16_9ZZZZ
MAINVTVTFSTPTLSVAIKLKVGVIPIFMVQPETISDEPSTTTGLMLSDADAGASVVTVNAFDNFVAPELSVATR